MSDKTAKLEFRVSPKLKLDFQRVCLTHYEMPSADMLRELAEAVVDKRISIKPSTLRVNKP